MTPDVRLAGRSGHYRLPLDVDKSKSALLSLQDPSSSTVFCAVRCDAGSQEECSSALSWPVLDVPLSQVMHAGGLLSDMLLGSQSMESVRTVFAPKVDALHHLHARSWGHSVSSQLMFSSVASDWSLRVSRTTVRPMLTWILGQVRWSPREVVPQAFSGELGQVEEWHCVFLYIF